MPAGSAPDSAIEAVGKPVVLMVNVLAEPSVNEALAALVIAGARFEVTELKNSSLPRIWIAT